MGYQAVFTGWENITLEDLLVAYRKAKADCFFENTFPAAIKFAEYEQDLLSNLKNCLDACMMTKVFQATKNCMAIFVYYQKNYPSNQRRMFLQMAMYTSPILIAQ